MRLEPVIVRLSRHCSGEVAEIDGESNIPPWSNESFQKEFSNKYSSVFGAVIGGDIVGFLVCHLLVDEAHIVNFGVRKSFRGRGIGRQMLDRVLRYLHTKEVIRVTLEVRLSNNVARALYESVGFRKAGVRKEYYSNNKEDGLIMSLDLPDLQGGILLEPAETSHAAGS